MSLLAILIIVGVLLVVALFALALVLNGRRRDAQSEGFADDVAAADRALEAARAADKGWDRAALEAAARRGLDVHRPGWAYDGLHLVLVDDRPGMAEDRAQVAAVGGDERVTVDLARAPSGEWSVASVS
jgi:hypothetical protein